MTVPTPASPSDPARATTRTGEPMTRSGGPTSSGAPGRIRLSAVTADGALTTVEGDAAADQLPALLAQPTTAVWVDMSEPSPAQVERVGAALALHPLIVEDVLEGNQRAKIETTDGVVHIVLFALERSRAERTASFRLAELDIVLGLGFLLTVHDRSWDPFASHHLRSGVGPILAHGPDHLLWAIGDDIVDGYFPLLDEIGEAIDAIQDEVISKATPETVERLFGLKRELIQIRRATSPTREVFNQLTNREMTLIDAEEVVYLRDVYDHVIRLTDELDNFRELAAATLDVYLTQVNNDLSRIMKRLTGVTVLLAGVGAVAGIFGMSEAAVEAGNFWIVTGAIVAGAGAAAVALRHFDWI
jgi:magnesium transporter